MKMMMIVMPRRKGEEFLTELINAGFTATYSETRGGMLRQSQLTLFIAVKAERVPEVMRLIRTCCSVDAPIHHGFGISAPFEAELANPASISGQRSAVLFVWSLDQFEIP